MRNLYLQILLLCFLSNSVAFSQTCECTDCPVTILDVQTVTSVLDVSGLTNSTLNSGGQGICEITLEYDHSWISDIEILLIAPDGSSIFLLADGGGASNSGSTWDISFFPCSDPVSPDPGASDVYTSDDFTTGTAYFGSYYPGSGCFSDFTGSANGAWTLQVNDLIGADVGEVTNWSITFCDGNGLDCSASTCEAELGDYSNQLYTFCEGDDPIILDPSITGGQTGADYNTTFVITTNVGGFPSEIIGYSDNADFTGFDAGLYYACGLNYLLTDEIELPTANAGNLYSDLEDLIADGTICGDLVEFDCLLVFIDEVPDAPTLDYEEVVCVGESSTVTVTNFDPDASYSIFTNSGSFSIFLVNLPNITFTPFSAVDIELCVNQSSVCGAVETCVNITVLDEIGNVNIEGETQVCAGELLNYTLSDLGAGVIDGWTISGDATIVGSTTDDNVDVQLDAIATTGSAELCVDVSGDCGDPVQDCLTINITDNVLVNSSFPDYCELDFDLSVLVNNLEGTGTWSVVSAPGSVSFDDNTSFTGVSVDALGDYILEFTDDCGQSIEVAFSVWDPLTTENVVVVCDGSSYTISFDIIGGEGPYSVDGVPITGSSFTSGNINDDPYFFTISDNVACIDWVLTGDPECSCDAEAGNINISNLQYCATDNILLNPTINDQNEEAEYGYTFTISNYTSGSIGTLVEYSDDPDLTGFDSGFYWVCGLSYLLDDEPLLPVADGTNSNFDINDAIADETICAELAAGCYIIEIQDEAVAPILDFEPVLCVGQASSITVTNYNPDLLYGITINSGSFSALSTGVPTTTFTPGSDLDITLCYTAFSICGDIETCADISVNSSSSENVAIEGNTGICPGGLENYTLSGLGGGIINGWTITGDASIVGSTTGDNVDVQIDNVATTGLAELCVDITTDCGDDIQECFEIDVILNDVTNNTETSFCTFDFEISALIDGGDGVGVWTVVTAPVGTLTFDDQNASTTGVTIGGVGVGDYVLQFTYQCNQSVQVEFTVAEPFETENIMVECTGTQYTVSFDIVGGTSPYFVDGVQITGNSFTSTTLTGDPYSFVISDSSDCPDLEVTGDADCGCDSDAGTINPQNLLVSCEGETVTATTNGDAFLDGDDTGIWILYTDENDPLNTILLENTTGDFSYTAPLDYAVTYYIAYIVGNEVAGTVDLDDPCLDIADGTSIIFSEPFELSGITVDPLSSCGSEFELTAIQTSPIVGTWGFISIPPGGTGDVSVINSLTTVATISGEGTFIVQYGTADGLCNAIAEVELEGPDVPTTTLLSTDCNTDNSTYQVTLDINGGTGPYSIDGTPFTGSVYTSGDIASGDTYSFVFTDVNGCESEALTGSFLCECESFAGNMPNELIEVCGDGSVTSVNDGSEILDGNDALVYILHTNAGNVLGTILDENQTGTFSLLAGMSYETTYFISAVVGNSVGNTVDLNDDCLNVATAQPVIWYEEIVINITSDPEIGCDDFELTATTNSSVSGAWTVLSNPPGSTVNLSNTTGNVTTAVVDLEGNYTLQYEVNNGPCNAINTVSFIKTAPPIISDVVYSCDDTNENYQVSFEISGGVPPYIVNGVTSGSSFTSNATPNGLSVDYVVTDASGCESSVLTANFVCDVVCTSDAGTMPQDLIEVCFDTLLSPIVTVSNDGNATLDSDDVGVYILHQSDQNFIQSALATSTDGSFSDLENIPLNTTLYISYVVGNELDSSVDFTDPCLSVSLGQPIIFYPLPEVTLGNDRSVCRLTTTVAADISMAINPATTWQFFDAPLGGNLNINQITLDEVEITASIPGTYSLAITVLANGCAASDTIDIEFRETPTVTVMDDFTSCNDVIELFSTKSGGSGEWFIPTLPEVIFATTPDSTSVVLDTFGVFEIIRVVSENNCTAADTVQVEIFPPSQFIIEGIECDDTNENYTIDYSIDGDNYPYTINGQTVNQGESIDLSASSGEAIDIIVLDNQLCEIYNDTITRSCECESSFGETEVDSYYPCIEDTLFVSQPDIILAEGDSLIYIFHLNNGNGISDIVATSGDGSFVFNPMTMDISSTIDPLYLVTPVVYSGGSFSLSSLDLPCTIVGQDNNIFWIESSLTSLPEETIELCESGQVTIPVTHMGQVPALIGIMTSEGQSFDVFFNQEGTQELTVQVDESITVSISSIFIIGEGCNHEYMGTTTININPEITIELLEDFEICNDPAEGNTSVVLNDLVLSNDLSGVWNSQSSSMVTNLNFDGTTPGDYVYTYNIEDELCGTVSESITITVIDCNITDCPDLVILPLPEACEGGTVINLNDYVLPEFVDQGFWTLSEGGINIIVEIPDISISAAAEDSVNFFYTLPGLPSDCDSVFNATLILNEPPSAGQSINTLNEYCEGSIGSISLFDLIENNDIGGVWSSDDTDEYDPQNGILNLSSLVNGSYQFDYTIAATQTCPQDMASINIQVINSTVQFDVSDPTCFGLADGAVEIFNPDGTPFTNAYQITDEDGEVVEDQNSLLPGAYTFEGIGNNGCEIFSGFVLADPLELFLDLGVDLIIEDGETVTIDANTNVSDSNIDLYEWLVNQSNIDAPTYENIILNPTGETLVELTIIDDDGCIVSDDILLTLLSTPDPIVDIILPNIFNADGSEFGIEAFAQIEVVNSFYIYDRWGNRVFAAEDYAPSVLNQKWNGDYNGSRAMSGVYVYMINYTDTSGQEEIIGGDVTLIR